MRDLKSNVAPVQSIAPAAAKTATVNGDGVKLQGCDSAAVIFNIGAWVSGTWTPKVQESDDNITFTDVAADDLEGSLTDVDGADDDNTVQIVGYKGDKLYVRGSVETASSPASLCVSAVVVKGHLAQRPA